MDQFKLIVKLAKVLSWPATVTLILYFIHKNYGETIASSLTGRARDEELRDPLPTDGVQAEDVENLQEKNMQVATEPDPDRRLEIAEEEGLAAEDVIGK